MKLSQMFTGQTQVGEVMHREETHAQQTAKNTASIKRKRADFESIVYQCVNGCQRAEGVGHGSATGEPDFRRDD